MEKQLLREAEIFPSKEVLKEALGGAFNTLEELQKILTQSEFALTFDWHYYKDGKSWLCKVCYKKKTIFWLSIWDGFFKTGFYFMDRHLEAIAALMIDEKSFVLEKAIGKMIPLIFSIRNKAQLDDLLKVVRFKKVAK
jgi:hypothetical protein